MGPFKDLDVGRPVPLASLVAAPPHKTLTPRQLALLERDEAIEKPINQAVVGPKSFAIPIKLKPHQNESTL